MLKISLLPGIMLSLFALPCLAQKSYTINMDGKGRIISSLPERLFPRDTISFQVTQTDEKFDIYANKLKDKLVAGQKNITAVKDNLNKRTLLLDLYGIGPDDVKQELDEIGKVINNPTQTPALSFVPSYNKDSYKTYFHFEFSNLKGQTELPAEPNKTYSISPVSLINNSKALGFTLNVKDPYQNLLFNWLGSTKNLYKQVALKTDLIKQDRELYKNKIQEIAALMDEIKKFVAGRKKIPSTKANIAKLQSILKRQTILMMHCNQCLII